MKYPKLRSNQILSDLMVEPAHLFNRKVKMTKLTCDNAIKNVYYFLFVFGQHSCSLGLPIKNREKEEKLVYFRIFCLHILVLVILYVFVLANNQYCSSNYTPHADFWNGQHNDNNNKSQHCCLCDKFSDGM